MKNSFMENEKFLNFISKKIEDIKYAIFYCHSNSQLRINNTVIDSSKVSDGKIIFLLNRPCQLLSQFDQEFPVGLNYFRKGKNFFMNVAGRARIVIDPEELAYFTDLSNEEINRALTTKVLVVVTISKVDFHDTNFEKKNLFTRKIKTILSALFDQFGDRSKSYHFGKNTPIENYGF